MKSGLLVVAATMLLTHLAVAQEVAQTKKPVAQKKLPPAQEGYSCFVPLNDPTNIQGDNIDMKLPIASTSKVITSFWAVKEKGVNYRFPTVFYTSKVGNDLYDLHIQGSRDPLFGVERMHYVISELNKKGITKIRNLTFDENFKFFWSIDDPKLNKSLAEGFYLPRDPVPDKVKAQLKAFPLLNTYADTYQKGLAAGIKMVPNPVFTVQSIDYESIADFKADPVENEVIYTAFSAPLANLLKEMNRNSNNHAANQIFEHMKAEEGKFSTFLEKSLDLDDKSITMLNGSGDRYETANGPTYNEASCTGMLKVLMALHQTLLDQKSSLTKIATVIGSNQGTPTSLYTNDKTYDTVVAKTGTVNPAVTLAGMASTKKGLVFFMFNMKTKGTNASWNAGRAAIRKKLTDLMTSFGGGVRLNAKAFTFLSFDNQSFSDMIPAEGDDLK
jgi:D-alanyl-D-alanine carboxypeptidase